MVDVKGCGLPVGATGIGGGGAAGTLRRRGRRRYSGAAFAEAKILKA